MQFKNAIGVIEEKYKNEYLTKYKKKEAMRIPEGTKVPIPLCVTQSLLIIV